jgi:hypothetical protein
VKKYPIKIEKITHINTSFIGTGGGGGGVG